MYDRLSNKLGDGELERAIVWALNDKLAEVRAYNRTKRHCVPKLKSVKRKFIRKVALEQPGYS